MGFERKICKVSGADGISRTIVVFRYETESIVRRHGTRHLERKDTTVVVRTERRRHVPRSRGSPLVVGAEPLHRPSYLSLALPGTGFAAPPIRALVYGGLQSLNFTIAGRKKTLGRAPSRLVSSICCSDNHVITVHDHLREQYH